MVVGGVPVLPGSAMEVKVVTKLVALDEGPRYEGVCKTLATVEADSAAVGGSLCVTVVVAVVVKIGS